MTIVLALTLSVVAAMPADQCSDALSRDCGDEEHKGDDCAQCLEEHREDIERARCELEELRMFCETPEMLCFQQLARDCLHERENATRCDACAKEHAKDLERAHCDAKEIEEFCHPPSQKVCEGVLEKDCGDDKGKGRECDICAVRHHEELLRAHCLSETVEGFCNGRTDSDDVVSPASSCSSLLKEDCGKDEKKGIACLQCIQKHAAALGKAHCTASDIEKFCQSPPVVFEADAVEMSAPE